MNFARCFLILGIIGNGHAVNDRQPFENTDLPLQNADSLRLDNHLLVVPKQKLLSPRLISAW